ncbi:MAG: EAL domain-containing protein [Methylophilus sp.]|nr:EAL domain-containing protein [Methylophilus sp.]
MTRVNKTYLHTFATLVFLIGFITLVGWVFQIRSFVMIFPEYPAMTIGAAVCFILTGLYIYLLINSNSLGFKKQPYVIAALITLISCLYLLEHLLSVNFGIDFPTFHQNMGSSGRPALNTVTGFLLFSVVALQISSNFDHKQNIHFNKLNLILSSLVVLIGVIGLIGYFLNLREMYSWGGFQSMALNTSIGITAIGVCLLIYLSEKPESTSGVDFENKIINITLVIMLAIGLGISALSFYLMEKKVSSALQTDLSTRAEDQAELAYQIIAHRSERAKVLSKSAEVINYATLITKQSLKVNLDSKLAEIRAGFVSNGFDKIDFVFPSLSKDYVSNRNENKTFFVELKGKYTGDLIWEDGYFLVSTVPVYSDKVLVANLITKQSLPPLNGLLPKVIKTGETNDVVICADAGKKLKCFPNRSNNSPFYVPKKISEQVLPMAHAVESAETGVIKATDYRGIKVMAAYTPVGDTGMGLVQKVDQSEIYNPIKLLMFKILSIAGAVLLFGYISIRNQLNPLVKQIIEEKKQSEIEKARFIAATEGGLDNFYIFEAVRNKWNHIVDLKCLFINKSGSALIKKAPGEMVGKLLLEEVPVNREKRLFDRYKYVIETGQTVSEEFPINDNDVNASWIYWQIVKLGDGVAITSRDITEKKRLEYELAKSDRLHSAIIESASYSIIATDVNGLIISMNKAAERMLWYRQDELVGKFTPEIIHDKEEVILRAEKLSLELGRKVEPGFGVFVANAIDDISSEEEWTYVRKDGSRFPVKLSVTVLKEPDGNVYGYLGIAYDISEQKRAEEYITHIALHDVLTGLPNRALFDDRVKVAIENAKRTNESLGVALLDLDHFKYINDSLGHHIGDKLLQVVSTRLLDNIRPTDTVARMGGDEFAFLFPNVSHPEGTYIVLQRLLSAFAPKAEVNGHILYATPSIGMAIYPTDGTDIETLLKNADTAMYRAKELGRNGYQIFDNEMRHLASLRMMREQELREALEKQQFELFYQPQINLDTLKIIGVESLIRWQKSPGVFISPVDFIPLAEETGLILPIGEWVIRTAIKQAKDFERSFGRPIRVAVNVSPRQFRQSGLVNHILNTLKEFKVSPEMFEVEITENLMMENIESSVEVMRALTNAGVKIALDDFGTGYSSLSYLSKFKFDRIKIDQSFIKNCLTNLEDAAIVKTIISMSKTLGVELIAEGIETKQQLDFIRLHKCEEAQGYFIGRPVSYDQILDKTISF